MLVHARIWLRPSDRLFQLSATNTRSMLFRFARGDAVLGGRATSLDGIEFAPGTEHRATIDFWAEEYAKGIVRDGARFTVWYGGDIGEGVVIAV